MSAFHMSISFFRYYQVIETFFLNVVRRNYCFLQFIPSRYKVFKLCNTIFINPNILMMNSTGRDVPPEALRLNAVLRKAGSAEVRAYAKYSADTTGMVLLK